MDAFYASVEQRDFPELKGKAVVVGRAAARGVVAAASYEARQYGIHSALPISTALRRYPDLIIQPARFAVYKQVSQQIQEIFHEYTDLVEPLSLDEAFLDVTENKKGIASATQIATEIREEIYKKLHLTASAGVSYNKFLAKMASDFKKPNGIYVIKPNQAEAFLAELDLAKFFGIGKVTSERLKSLGFIKGRDLLGLDLAALEKIFGKNALFFYNIIRGIDVREVSPERIRKSISVENTFEQDLSTKFAIITELYNLEKRLAKDLERLQKKAKTVTLKVRYNDFKTLTRSKTMPYTISTFDEIKKISRELLNEIDFKDKSIRLLGIGVSNLFDLNELPNQQLEIEF